MIQGNVIARAGRRTSHQKRSALNTIPVIQGIQNIPRGSGASAEVRSGPALDCSIQTRSGTSATNTTGISPAFGKERLRRMPEAAAASGPRKRLMETDLAAGLCGLVDGVDDPHDLEPLLGGSLGLLPLRDTP